MIFVSDHLAGQIRERARELWGRQPRRALEKRLRYSILDRQSDGSVLLMSVERARQLAFGCMFTDKACGPNDDHVPEGRYVSGREALSLARALGWVEEI